MTGQLSKPARERCEEDRKIFAMVIGAEDPTSLVFLDETSVDLRVTYRLMGWGRIGSRSSRKSHFVRGTRHVNFT